LPPLDDDDGVDGSALDAPLLDDPPDEDDVVSPPFAPPPFGAELHATDASTGASTSGNREARLRSVRRVMTDLL